MAFSKLTFLHPLVSLPALLFLSCNCTVLNPSQENSNPVPSPIPDSDSQVKQQNVPEPAVGEARVQKALQSEVFAAAESKEDWQHVYALFSQSSYVDRGQIWVYRNEASNLVMALKPGVRKLSEATTLNSSSGDVQALYNFLVANADIIDFDANSFDGVQFEFVHAERKDGIVKIVKRVFMNNPPDPSKHTELIQSFHNLLP